LSIRSYLNEVSCLYLSVSELKGAKCSFKVSITSIGSLKHYVVIKLECNAYI